MLNVVQTQVAAQKPCLHKESIIIHWVSIHPPSKYTDWGKKKKKKRWPSMCSSTCILSAWDYIPVTSCAFRNNTQKMYHQNEVRGQLESGRISRKIGIFKCRGVEKFNLSFYCFFSSEIDLPFLY